MPKNPVKDNLLSVFKLRYKKGDLIIREGDYGLSIYKIVEGEVKIFTETEDLEIPLATLGPGSVIGEMIFLNRKIERRSASARAIKDSILEVWHPKLLRMEYEQMPPIIKYLSDQALNRLIRMNKLVVKLTDDKNKRAKNQEIKDPWAAKRRYYRKLVKIDFNCRTIRPTAKNISGKIKDISLGGAGLEVQPNSGQVFSYKPGDKLIINTTLPNGKQIDFTAEIVSIKMGESEGSIVIGVSFTDLSGSSAKDLGFFLMP